MIVALWRQRQATCQCQRTFTYSAIRAATANLKWEKNDPEVLADVVPPYPYGPTRLYKQSKTGLYGGQRIRFGNNVGEVFGVKSRRTWRVNVVKTKLFSKALNQRLKVRLSTRVLRTIDKLGGMDEYLLGEKPARIKALGETGWWLRWAIMQTPTVKKRFARQERSLGLPSIRPVALQESQASEEMVDEVSDEVNSEYVSDEANTATSEAAVAETTPMRKPIKFRVRRGRHLILTDRGWLRARPYSYFMLKARENLEKKTFPSAMKSRMAALERELEKLKDQDHGEAAPLSTKEVDILRSQAKREIKQEFLGTLHQFQLEKQAVRTARLRLQRPRTRAFVMKRRMEKSRTRRLEVA